MVTPKDVIATTSVEGQEPAGQLFAQAVIAQLEAAGYCIAPRENHPKAGARLRMAFDSDWLKRKIAEDGEEGEIGAGFELFPLPAAAPPAGMAEALRVTSLFADQYRGGAQGASMDCDAAAALAKSIDGLTAALSAAPGSGLPRWRTMDTAPKDGTHILLRVPVHGGFIYAVEGAFVDNAWHSAFQNNVTPLHWAPKPSAASALHAGAAE